MVARARRDGLLLSPRQVFEYQTIAELAAVAVDAAVSYLVNHERMEGAIPLTPIQHWFFAQTGPMARSREDVPRGWRDAPVSGAAARNSGSAGPRLKARRPLAGP